LEELFPEFVDVFAMKSDRMYQCTNRGEPRPIRQTSEIMLHKDYDRKGSAEKKILVVGLKELDAKTDWW
jgi:hypothetical protein